MGTSWKRLLALEVSAFSFFGLFGGCYAVLLADLSGALGLSPEPLGIALFVGAGAAIACLGLLAEGEMFQWSGIYLRDTLGLAAVVGGSGVAVFYGAHALGRLAIGWLVGRAGNRRTLVGSGALAAVGMAFSLATTVPALVVGGFLLVGVGLAAVAPVAFSVAGI